ncbi:MAG: hypothetical protein PUD92_08310 [Clostridiales bacterium]|nr:hypothetical protein [Clostridiales bacterium]
MADIIVYKQTELDRALEAGIKSITLCAGDFIVPKTKNVSFDRIGPVRVTVLCSKPDAEAAGMVFIDTYPTYKSSYAIESRASMAVVAAFSSGSFVGSGSGSFSASGLVSGSGSGVHSHEYEFEYEFSFRTSFGTSFRGSFGGSYSLSVGYSFPGSAGGSYRVLGSCAGYASDIAEMKTVRVFGYGINLI